MKHTWLTILAAVGCGAVPSAPQPEAKTNGEQFSAVAKVPAEETKTEPAEPARPAYVPREEDIVQPSQPIEIPSEDALDGFFAALTRTDEGEAGALTRVLHMGDSSIGLDQLPHAIRKRMQTRFGDGGAGFVHWHRYTKNYRTLAASVRTSPDWDRCYISYRCSRDDQYGLGGSMSLSEGGDYSVISTLDKGDFGRSVSSFEVWYAAHPHGGRFTVRVDGGEATVIKTKADELEDRWQTFDVEPGPHKLQIRALSGYGKVRGYGVVLETDGPGVVWDGLSMIGAFTKRLLYYDADHIASQMKHRDPDLLVLNYGGNDLRRAVKGAVDGETYKEEYRGVLKLLRAGKPEMACLVMSVIDHGRSGDEVVLPRHVDLIVDAQREVAFEQGCAFFDTYQAMGGPGSIYRWLKRKPRLAAPDLKHLSLQGREHMSQIIFEAIIARYVEYRGRQAS